MRRSLPALSSAHAKLCRYSRMYAVVTAASVYQDHSMPARHQQSLRSPVSISRDEAAVSASLIHRKHVGTGESVSLTNFGLAKCQRGLADAASEVVPKQVQRVCRRRSQATSLRLACGMASCRSRLLWAVVCSFGPKLRG